ncbi:hypothetical protein PENTCL1PPCAC_4711, partial [Pristionchus entomophagus]
VNLATLPVDIIRKICKIDVEHLERIRLISPRWNTLAFEHLANRKYLPAIKSFSWSRDLYEEITMNIRIPPELQEYFGVEKWKKKRKDTERVRLIALNSNKHKKRYSDCLARIFDRCSRIEKLEHIT